jgi:alkanesulfonate monooxygenase SsuD/methylene tetrahydromethanopterin reductase-like flavin-dependent oxidoreductase (luciferase family)
MGATLQVLSGGRFVLGMGAGWHEEEYHAYGFDFPPARVRVEQLDEALQIIQALWTQHRATFTGQHYRVIDACCEPRPVPLPPVIVGGAGPKMLRLAARHADGWNVSSTGLPAYRHLAEEMARACAETGRDPGTLSRSWVGGCACAATREQAVALAGDLYSAENPGDDFGFVGTPGQVIAQIQPFIELGVETFMLDCGGFPDLGAIDLLVREVIPAVNG